MLKTNNSEQHKNFMTKVAVIIVVLIQFYMSAFGLIQFYMSAFVLIQFYMSAFGIR